MRCWQVDEPKVEPDCIGCRRSVLGSMNLEFVQTPLYEDIAVLASRIDAIKVESGKPSLEVDTLMRFIVEIVMAVVSSSGHNETEDCRPAVWDRGGEELVPSAVLDRRLPVRQPAKCLLFDGQC